MLNKKLLFILTVVLMLITTGLTGIETPWLHVDGNQIQDPEGNEVILRGLNFVSIWVSADRIGPRYSFYPHSEETDEGKANLKGLIDMATDNSQGWYATILRLPVYPWQVDTDPGWVNCTTDELARYKELLDCAVEYAASKGVYVIIDWHYVHDYGDKLDECLDFWDYIADKYKNMSHVLFELYNEPIAFEETFVPNEPNYEWAPWKDTIAQPLVDRIRNYHNAQNIIIVGGPRWSQLLGGAYDNPVEGDNIAYACHIYPYHFENQGGGADPGDLSPYVGQTIEKYPVFFTEWGFQDGGNIPCDALDEDYYAAGMKQYLIDNRTSWCAWVFDPWWEPIMFDNWDFQGLLGNSLPDTGGYMGQMVKDFLAEFKDSNLPGGSTGNELPVVSITAPANSTAFEEGDSITITADASDSDGTVTLVEFYYDAVKIGEDSSAPYSITWSNAASGNYAITAKATDNSNETSTSSAINIIVNTTGENSAPAISITSPVEGAEFAEDENITITADASDSDGTVTLVEFYYDAVKIGEDSSAPYSIVWEQVPIGNYVITAVATDNETASTVSTPVNISVSNSSIVYEEITAPFTQDGTGEFYWKTTDIPGYVNSWNLDLLEINGIDLTNTWKGSGDLPAKQDGYYYIHYIGSYSWCHFELK